MATSIAASSLSVATLSATVEVGNVATKAGRVLIVSKAAVATNKASRTIYSQQQSEDASPSRRAMLSLLAATAAAGAFTGTASAEGARKIVVDTKPPPPSGGLPGTENSDQARDLDAPLKERFFLQSLDVKGAVARAQESADAIVGVKPLIEKKAWPYVQNELRNKAGYLRFDLNTVISSKAKGEKKQITALANKLYDSIADLDYAARKKSSNDALKSYDSTVSLLKEVLSKLA
jgi:photosystem II oxygen-evolving enhancer protein 3